MTLGKLDKVLLQTVQSQLGLVIDVDLEWLFVSLVQGEQRKQLTDCINFLQVVRISLESVAENIITCLWWGVARKIS